jgi:hypothetical protein
MMCFGKLLTIFLLNYVFILTFDAFFCSDFEIQRQIGILEEGGKIENETRSFDAETGQVQFSFLFVFFS